jgi:hypothetical protein
MTIAEFREKHMKCGMSVMEVADLATRLTISDDEEFALLAKDALEAEDKFYVAMLERGLEQ